jgi:pyruvate dehydrogenase E1 component alpha subunit
MQGEELFLDGLVAPYREQALALIRRQVPTIDRFVAVGEYCAAFMSTRLEIPPTRISVVPLGISMEGYARPDSGRPDGAPFRVGYFARIAPEKGLDVLAEAYVRLRRRTGGVAMRLEVAGYLARSSQPYLESVREILVRAGLDREFAYRGDMQMALKQGDQVITGYRDHGHMLACGMEANGVMAELTGRRGGYSKGKGGSMHMFSMEKNFYGGHGIVGAQVSLGTGLAFANRYRGNDLVSVAYFGDGASNQGQVYESFNMAELWKLPVIYVIENNRYAMGTSVTRSSAQTDFSKRGISFNIPGEQVDGMDVRAVKAAGDEAVAWCRAGKGPFILEMQTYRYRGHSMSDPAKYRTREEVEKIRHDQDPIEQVRNRLLAAKVSEQELKAIDAEVREIVNASADFAQRDPEPDPSELWTDVYR